MWFQTPARWLIRPLLWAASLLWVTTGMPAAQGQGVPDRSADSNISPAVPLRPNPPESAPLQEVAPRVIYVRDEQGKLVPLINVPLERLQQLLNQQDGVVGNEQPPQFQIDMVSIQGRAADQVAELDVDVAVTLLQRPTGDGSAWLSIPLRFHDAALLAPPEHEGEGELYLVFDEGEGYQAWLRHTQLGTHRLRLKLAVPLSQAADATQLRFFPPLGNRSQLELRVPGGEITANVENARNLTLSTDGAAETTLRANDLRNQVAITWRQGGALAAQNPTYLDVRGDIRVSIDGPGAIRSNVTLDLQSWGRPIEQFTLRLPPNTKIVSGNQPGYRVSESAERAAVEGQAGRATVQIKLDKPAAQTRVQLTTQTADQVELLSEFNVANYEVEGAISQSGRVSLLTSAEWLVYWTLGPSVRRVQSLEPFEAPQERELLASFEYFRQPCRLDVQIKPQGTRIGVEPLYRMRVTKDRVSLEAQLNYKMRGARVSFLSFSPNGWQLDDVGPTGTVENDDYRNGGNEPLKLRLTKATSGDLSLTLNLHRPLDSPQGTLRVPLPWPAADAISPGSLIVSSADAIRLDYRLAEMVGLVQDPLILASTPATERTGPTQSAAAFRFLSDRTLGEVVIDYQLRSQETRVRVDTSIEVSGDTAQVTQRFGYRVLYEPAALIQLALPQELYDLIANPRFRDQVDFRLDDQSLGTDWLPDAVEDRRGPVPVSVPLDRGRLGSFELQVRYPWPVRSASPDAPISIPLATARDGQLVANTATIASIGALRVDPANDANWSRDDKVLSMGSLPTVGMASTSQPSEIRLRLSQLVESGTPGDPLSATVIQRAWLQTWLSLDQRMDRAVYRITTGADTVRCTLPPGVTESLAVVDGQPLATKASDGQVAISLPGGPATEHTIELSLRYAGRPSAGELRFVLPQLQDAVGPRRWFWQLLLPADEHLLLSDRRLTSANRWVRQGLFWRRQETEAQANLEHWTQATVQAPLPVGLNQYLFSSFEKSTEVHVRTCRRYTLVYLASTCLLALGLGLLYLPGLRHPALLIVIAVLMVAAAWLYLDTALMVSQAGLLGLALVLLAAITASLSGWAEVGSSLRAPLRRSHDSRSGVPAPWREGVPPPTTIAAPVASVTGAAPESKA